MPSTCFPFSMNSGHHPNTSPLVSPIFPITFSPSNRHTHLHKNSQSHPSTHMGSKHASCLHHLPPHISHRSPRLHQRRVCQRPGELHAPPYAHGVVIPAPATMAAAHSRRRQTAATAPLFIAPPQLPSSSRCRSSPLHRAAGGGRLPLMLTRRWRGKRLKKGCLSFAHHGFGLGFEFGAHPICIEG